MHVCMYVCSCVMWVVTDGMDNKVGKEPPIRASRQSRCQSSPVAGRRESPTFFSFFLCLRLCYAYIFYYLML
ncbi:hypothetical protein F5Y00DRAFT_229861 [Daldinia vernicosa]|uniref:uncharacterized protein n=1 Tax=Daldinia vernicosa TaxID=114800 RepID=UPI0020086324|nr:uncharacterized protein F5Y00DRAFT_229861 [Daldinia vernicosa]KAI0851494.1 hypothetical protein F5Y00DRAFT_229861 [Daldinia vernicosa]